MPQRTALLLVLVGLSAACAQPTADVADTASVDAGGADAADATPACTRTGAALDAGMLDTGPVVQATHRPPALSGGTLLVTRDTRFAIASDPDRDVVWIVDLGTRAVHGSVALESGDEPGRLVEDDAGIVHVVLRQGGAVVDIDPSAATLLARRAVCGAPRGIAFDGSASSLYVTCADGSLLSLPTIGGTASRIATLDADLRDVVVNGGQRYVSRFRSADVMLVGSDGSVSARVRPATIQRVNTSATPARTVVFEPDVAWRLVGLPGGGALMLHQRAQSSEVSGSSGVPTYYGTQFADGCSAGIVHGVLSTVTPDGTISLGTMLGGVPLPIDLAVSSDGSVAAVVMGGVGPQAGSSVALYDLVAARGTACMQTASSNVQVPNAVAVAFVGTSEQMVVVQTLEPAALVVSDGGGAGTTIPLADATSVDTGFTLFHTAFGGGVACAGCHPEAGDDGHVWTFPCDGARRTQSLRGGLLATAPFHWDGHLADFHALSDEVFVERLGTGRPSLEASNALGSWLDAQPNPAPTSAADPAAAARGRAIFEDPNVGCATCHAGARYTNNQTVDVGTGGLFQVPSLNGVAFRAPYMHDGCAATLHDRFGPCGGGDMHGHTSQLTPAQIDDLVTYLQTL